MGIVHAGDPLRIPARVYNRLVELERTSRIRPLAPQSRSRESARDYVSIYNPLGNALPAFSIVELDGAATPLDDENALALKFPAFKCKTPSGSAGKRIAVLQQSAQPNEIVPAIICGVTACRLKVSSDSHGTAAVKPNESGYLVSSSSGSIPILHKEGGTGEVWAYVLLGAECEIPLANRRGVTLAPFTQNSSRTAGVSVRLYMPQSPDKGQSLGSETVTAYCLRAKPGDTISSGKNVILTWVDDHYDMEPEC